MKVSNERIYIEQEYKLQILEIIYETVESRQIIDQMGWEFV